MSQMRCAYVSELHIKKRKMEGSGILSSMRKYLNVDAVKRIGEKASDLAFGEVGTAISNLIPDSDSKARPLFVGEKHALLKLPNGKMGRANFMGPGTQVVKRLKRGDVGRTPSDNVAQMHDLNYKLATSVDDIRKADERMVNSLKKIEARGGDSRINTQMGMRLIQGKMLAEEAGLLSRNKFAGDLKGVSPADKPLVLEAKRKLEIQGYGKKTKVSKKLPPGVALRRSLLKKNMGKKNDEMTKAVVNIMKELRL
jgi:hypothetical protein